MKVLPLVEWFTIRRYFEQNIHRTVATPNKHSHCIAWVIPITPENVFQRLPYGLVNQAFPIVYSLCIQWFPFSPLSLPSVPFVHIAVDCLCQVSPIVSLFSIVQCPHCCPLSLPSVSIVHCPHPIITVHCLCQVSPIVCIVPII